MNVEEFKLTLSASSPPPSLTEPLRALWFSEKGNWMKAHEIAQEIHSEIGSWIHAYLHREEGDIENASYWYSQAKKPLAKNSLQDEWEQIAQTLLR